MVLIPRACGILEIAAFAEACVLCQNEKFKMHSLIQKLCPVAHNSQFPECI